MLLGTCWENQTTWSLLLELRWLPRRGSAQRVCKHSLNACHARLCAGEQDRERGTASCPPQAAYILGDKGLAQCSEIILKPIDTKCKKGYNRDETLLGYIPRLWVQSPVRACKGDN